MADYKELLRRAISALPENNGSARRTVYEKARAALEAQLRAIDPPLSARDIINHRLQLEDCIRDVEHESTEALLGGMKRPTAPVAPAPRPAAPVAAPPAPPPAPTPAAPVIEDAAPEPVEQVAKAAPVERFEPEPEQMATERAVAMPSPHVTPAKPQTPVEDAVPAQKADTSKTAAPARFDVIAPVEQPVVKATAPMPAVVLKPTPKAPDDSIEAIIAAADRLEKIEEPDQSQFETEPEPEPEPEPAPEPRRPAAQPTKPEASAPARPVDPEPTFEPESEPEPEPEPVKSASIAQRLQARMKPARTEPEVDVSPAMSRVREVEVEPRREGDPQHRIDRAIATLDRAARGEDEDGELDIDDDIPPPRSRKRAIVRRVLEDDPEPEPRRRGNALGVFLGVTLVLFLLAGGGAFWAWNEGYLDSATLFGGTDAPEPQPAPAQPAQAPADGQGPGNTVTPAEPSTPEAPLRQDERLAPTQDTPPVRSVTAEDQNGGDRLGAAPAETQQPAGEQSGVAPGGAQSLLLEASPQGTTGAVPYSGTVDWSRGVDELGQPTLLARASIPARNLSVSLLIRKNSDASLPASHIVEVDFEVSDSFAGGSIAGLPGILLKNEELVGGTPLIGASARVVGNSFLFAMSASEQDKSANMALLGDRKWIDLAMVYATGRRAVVTLEKDEAAQALFNEVMTAWGDN